MEGPDGAERPAPAPRPAAAQPAAQPAATLAALRGTVVAAPHTLPAADDRRPGWQKPLPPSLDPAVLRHRLRDAPAELTQTDAAGEPKHAAIRDAHRAVVFAKRTAGEIAGAIKATLADTTRTEAGNLVQAAAYLDARQRAALEVMDGALDGLRREVAAIEASFHTDLVAARDPYDAERRAVLRGMTPQERAAYLSEAIAEADLPTLAAVLLPATPRLSGLNRAEHALLWTRARHGVWPEREARLRGVRAAAEAVREAGELFLGHVGGYLDRAAVEQARKSAAAARSARGEGGS